MVQRIIRPLHNPPHNWVLQMVRRKHNIVSVAMLKVKGTSVHPSIDFLELLNGFPIRHFLSAYGFGGLQKQNIVPQLTLLKIRR